MNEPLLMQNQEGALNQDTFAQQEFINLKNKFGLNRNKTCYSYTRFCCSKQTTIRI